MSMDTSGFDEYATEYERLTTTLPSRLAGAGLKSGPEAERELRNVENDISQARQLLNSMDMEARGMDASIKRTFQDRIKKYRAELSEQAGALGRAQNKVSRSALGVDIELSEESVAQRSRLMASSERAAETTRTLEQSRRTLQETTDVALGITTELHRNRETIESAHAKVKDTRSMLGNARRVLGRMTKRELQYKVMLVCIIIFLIAMIGVIIYFLFIAPSGNSSGSGTGSGTGRLLR